MESSVANKSKSADTHPSVNLLLLITGSIAAVKTGLLLDQLAMEHCTIRIGATNSAFHFLKRAQPSKTGIPFQSIITDEEEWKTWQAMDDVVIHIALRKWADLVLIAPLDANSLGKLANGLCDNLVTLVMRAWDLREKPVIVCPAMNSAMWAHPITTEHINTLRNWYMGCSVDSVDICNTENNSGSNTVANTDGTSSNNTLTKNDKSDSLHENSDKEAALHKKEYSPSTFQQALFQVVGPVKKQLACGDIGTGGMASVEEISKVVRHTMHLIRAKKIEEQQRKMKLLDTMSKEIHSAL